MIAQVLPESMCPYNLLVANCRLYDQESARGPIVNDSEHWIERALQEFKELMRFRLSRNAEAMLAKDWLDREALAQLSHTVRPSVQLEF